MHRAVDLNIYIGNSLSHRYESMIGLPDLVSVVETSHRVRHNSDWLEPMQADRLSWRWLATSSTPDIL